MPKRPSVRRALEAGVELAVDDLVELWPISRKYATDIFAKIRLIDEVAIFKNDDGAFVAE